MEVIWSRNKNEKLKQNLKKQRKLKAEEIFIKQKCKCNCSVVLSFYTNEHCCIIMECFNRQDY